MTIGEIWTLSGRILDDIKQLLSVIILILFF